jgi:transposase
MPRRPKTLPAVPEVAPVKKAVMGRPTLYRPEYCQKTVELGKLGKSFAQIASHFEVDRVTLDNWAENNPEFFKALSRAKTEAQAWWEQKGMDGMEADKFNALVWKTSVQARFREDYTEKRINEHSGPNGGPIQTEAKVIDASALSAEEREAMRAVLLLAKGKG